MVFRLGNKPKDCEICGGKMLYHPKCGRCSILLHKDNKDEINWWFCKKCVTKLKGGEDIGKPINHMLEVKVCEGIRGSH